VFRIKYEEVFSYKPNADTSHLLDSLVSALAVYATAFRSKLSLVAERKSIAIMPDVTVLKPLF